MLKWGFLVLNAFSLPSRWLTGVRFGIHWIKGSLSMSLRGRRSKGMGYEWRGHCGVYSTRSPWVQILLWPPLLNCSRKKIPGVLHWRKLGTYRLWGVQLFTAFHSHNITSSNKLVMSLFIENRVKGILKINSIIIKRTPSTEKRPSFSDHFASTRAHYFSIDGKLQSCIRVKYMFCCCCCCCCCFSLFCFFYISPCPMWWTSSKEIGQCEKEGETMSLLCQIAL